LSENVGASTSRNPKGLHGLYGDNFTFLLCPDIKGNLKNNEQIFIHECGVISTFVEERCGVMERE
jgi:hypothetical protein